MSSWTVEVRLHPCWIIAPHASAALTQPVDLPRLPVLQFLDLTLETGVENDGSRGLPTGLNSLVASLPALVPRLEVITFTVLQDIVSARIQLSTRVQVPWEQPVSPLSVFDTADYRAHFPRLRRVHCCFTYVNRYGPPDELALRHFVRFMESKLPAPHADGILTFVAGVQRSLLDYMHNLP